MSMPARQITSMLFSARNWKLFSSADIGVAIGPVRRERPGNGFRGETGNGLSKLGIDFVSDGHDPNQQHAVVDAGQVLLQGVKYTELQNSRLLDWHGGGIALPVAVGSVLDSVAGCQISGAGRLSGVEPRN